MKRIALLTIACWLAATTEPSASPVGSLAGYVRDQSGRPLAGVEITVTGEGAVGVYHATTNAEGLYQIVGLPTLEPLEVTARFEGRIPLTYAGLEVRAGEVTRRDFRLRPQGAHDVLVMYDPRVPYHAEALDGIRQTLEGRITVLELGDDRRSDLALLRETLQSRFNAVLAIGSDAARIARREVRDAPVVYTMVLDPRVEDLRRLNLCGLTLNGAFDDQLAALATLKPDARRIATIYDPRRLAGVVVQLRRAAASRGMRLTSRPARNAAQVRSALDVLRDKDLDAFVFLLDPGLFDAGSFELVRRFAESRRLVFVVPDPSFVAVGGTFSYGPGFREMGVYAARLVLHIFSGAAEPSEIAVSYPVERRLTINPHEADRLGLRLPESWRRPSAATPLPGETSPTGIAQPR